MYFLKLLACLYQRFHFKKENKPPYEYTYIFFLGLSRNKKSFLVTGSVYQKSYIFGNFLKNKKDHLSINIFGGLFKISKNPKSIEDPIALFGTDIMVSEEDVKKLVETYFFFILREKEVSIDDQKIYRNSQGQIESWEFKVL